MGVFQVKAGDLGLTAATFFSWIRPAATPMKAFVHDPMPNRV